MKFKALDRSPQVEKAKPPSAGKATHDIVNPDDISIVSVALANNEWFALASEQRRYLTPEGAEIDDCRVYRLDVAEISDGRTTLLDYRPSEESDLIANLRWVPIGNALNGIGIRLSNGFKQLEPKNPSLSPFKL